jgi:hypothetical protein
MKKVLLVSGMVLFLFYSVSSQENKKVSAKNSNIEFYGFIRSEFYYDSYKGINAAMDNFYLFPLYKGVDPEGNDVNQQGITNFTAMATRFGMNISGGEILGAKTIANIETDFAGILNEYPEVLRLRKANVQFNWEKSTLLVGQTWHPFWGHGAFFPQVGGLNTGAPFNPFNRSPQVDFDYRLRKVTLSLTALYEYQYCSKGFYDVPNNNSKNLAKRNAGIPEMVAGLYYDSPKLSAGVAGQYNAIKPIATTDKGYVTNNLNHSFSAMGFLGHKSEKLFILAKGLIGQNLVNMTMPGGYGVKDYNSTTGEMKYTNYTTYSAFINMVYGKTVQLGFLSGVTGNLGTSDPLFNFNGSAKTLGLFPNIKNIYRVSPHVAYNVKNLRFIAEVETTLANYGAGNFNFSDGLYNNHFSATNNRIFLVLMYNF